MIIPDYSTLKQWAASLVEDFEEDNIPLLEDEDQWKEWGYLLMEVPAFIGKGAPSPQGYENWKSWAKGVYLVLG